MRSSPFTGPRRSALLVALSLVAILSAAEGRAQVIFPEKISDFVTLNDTPGMGPCDWTRLNYNGGRSLFSLPANTAFVITSLQWSFSDALPYKRTSLKLIRGTGDPIHYTDGTYELLATVDGGNADAWGGAPAARRSSRPASSSAPARASSVGKCLGRCLTKSK